MINSQHGLELNNEHYFVLDNSFSGDYTFTQFNYIDESSIYQGETAFGLHSLLNQKQYCL